MDFDKKKILLLIVLLVILPMPIYALGKTDYLKYVDNYVSLDHAYTEYQICNPTTTQITTTAKNTNNFDWSFTTAKGTLKDSWFEIRLNETYTYDEWISKMVCKPYIDSKNSSIIDNCTDNGYNEKKYAWRWIWSRFEPTAYSYPKQTCFNIRIYGTYPIAFGKNGVNIDNVLKFVGYTYDEYAWWNATWSYKMNRTLKSDVSTDEILPRNTTLNTWDLINAGKLRSNCYDLRFTNESDLEIPFYIEGICGNTSTNTNSTIWFKTTTKADNSSVIWVYYGNPSASDGQNKNGVYDFNYKLVYDMGEGTGTTLNDATSNANTGTLTGASWTNGFFRNGTAYDGSNDKALSNGNVPALNATGFTIEFWFYYINKSDATFASLVSMSDDGKNPKTLNQLNYDNCNGKIMFVADDISATTEHYVCANEPIPVSRWVYYVANWNGTYINIFLNGTLRSDASTNGANMNSVYSTATIVQMMRQPSSERFTGGYLDNPRVSDIARSPNYIKMVYDTATKSALTTAWGTEQTYSSPTSTTLLIDNAHANITTSCGMENHNYTAYINTTGLNVSILYNGANGLTGASPVSWYADLIAGVWNISANYTTNGTYGSSGDWLLHTITLGTPSVSLNFNTTNGNNTTCMGTIINISCNSTALEDGVFLWNDTYDSITNPYEYNTTVVGVYWFHCNWTSGDCYQNGEVNRTLEILDCSECIPDWSCTEWSACVDGYQFRECTDLNQCGDNRTKPTESQNCTLPPILNATGNISTACCPISTLYCYDNNTLIQAWLVNNVSSYAYETCFNGCDNQTMMCSPPAYESNLITIGIIIVIIIGIAMLYKWSRR